jgi:predicted transport protein
LIFKAFKIQKNHIAITLKRTILHLKKNLPNFMDSAKKALKQAVRDKQGKRPSHGVFLTTGPQSNN